MKDINSMIKIGDKLVCNNGKTYIIGKGSYGFEFSILNEDGNELNLYHDYSLYDCLPIHEEDQKSLYIDDNGLKWVVVLKHIKIVNDYCWDDEGYIY